MTDVSRTASSRTGQILTAKLRFGWTTGTCATAAVNAAYTAFLTGQFPTAVSVVTPSGKQADLDVTITESGSNEAGKPWSMAGVIKDAGDDPDVTHGALICARVSAGPEGGGITFAAGEGVGIVTKPGLPVPVGEPAINPVPRQMMSEMISELAAKLGGSRDMVIEIIVPDGAAIAQKTWNPRLGIKGGISILGTTGVVRPFSCSAWIASIHRGIDVARANGLSHVMASTGATSEAYGQSLYGLPDIALIDMGDFVGGMLKYLRRHPVANLTLLGGFGKMIKLAQGALDLHSARSQIDFSALARMAADCGMDEGLVANANSALEVSQRADESERAALAGMVAQHALSSVMSCLKGAPVNAEVIIVDRGGQPVGHAGSVLR